MTPDQYKKRIEALGFNQSQWARFVGIDRTTHFRHLKGPDHPSGRSIPQTLKNIVEWLENGKLDNPNDR